jgi:hypothetical protein
VRPRRAARHPARDHRQAQRRDQCRPRRPRHLARPPRLAAPIFYTPDGFGVYVAQEVEKWGKVIASGAKPD